GRGRADRSALAARLPALPGRPAGPGWRIVRPDTLRPGGAALGRGPAPAGPGGAHHRIVGGGGRRRRAAPPRPAGRGLRPLPLAGAAAPLPLPVRGLDPRGARRTAGLARGGRRRPGAGPAHQEPAGPVPARPPPPARLRRRTP